MGGSGVGNGFATINGSATSAVMWGEEGVITNALVARNIFCVPYIGLPLYSLIEVKQSLVKSTTMRITGFKRIKLGD